MQALVYTNTQTLVYREEQNPTEKPGESILKIQASGICGSDMHAYHGHDERRVPPLILGHEVSGIIQNGKFKDKVVVLNPLITCGNCEYCKQPWTYQRALGVRGTKNTARKRAGVETNFSIDRLDTTKTYSRDNLVFCCVGCNNRKNQVRISDIMNILKVWKERTKDESIGSI